MFVFGAYNLVDLIFQSFKRVERSCEEHEWYKHPFFKLADPNLKINAEKTKYVLMDKIVFDIESVAKTT